MGSSNTLLKYLGSSNKEKIDAKITYVISAKMIKGSRVKDILFL